MVLGWLIPKEHVFFDLFEEQAELLLKAAMKFEEILKTYSRENLKKGAKDMKSLEVEADHVTGNILRKSSSSFMTPLEREDIDKIAKSVDSVIDRIEGVTSRLEIYQIPLVDENMLKLMCVLKEEAVIIEKTIPLLRNAEKNKESIRESCNKIMEKEREGDEIYRNALRALLKNDDPIKILKTKEIYDTSEFAIDKCKKVGNVFLDVVAKLA